MVAVSKQLRNTIKELLNLQSLQDAYLGGGTNLALRYNHRQSDDIDLFFSNIIGKTGYKAIEDEVRAHFGDRLANLHYPDDTSDQYVFLRFWVKTAKVIIKVEIMQNFNFLDAPDVIEDIRLASIRDVGLMKLMTAANRGSYKDVYDLDYLTEDLSLKSLIDDLKEKQAKLNAEEHKTIFEKDGTEISPVVDPLRLLKYDQSDKVTANKPNHSSNRVLILAGSKNLLQAKTSYRRKVRSLCNQMGLEFPGVQPQN